MKLGERISQKLTIEGGVNRSAWERQGIFEKINIRERGKKAVTRLRREKKASEKSNRGKLSV